MIRCAMRVVAISGSLQARSSNLELLRLATYLAPNELEISIGDHLRHLPLFNPDLEAASVPTPVQEWRTALEEADAVLIACPEYGHSLPGALKNAVDWVIGSGQFHEKAVAITASVGHPSRGRLGLDALATTLRAVDANIVWNEAIVAGPDSEPALTRLLVSLTTDR